MKPAIISCIILFSPCIAQQMHAAAWHVDSVNGSDAHSGLSPDQAWKTLDKVNSIEFQPGDVILFAPGSSFEGCLRPQGKGKPEAPIIVKTAGKGARAAIHANGKTEAALHLYNTEGWEISALEITNTSEKPKQNLKGVHVQLEDYGTARHIVLRDLYIHDVTATVFKDHGSSGGIHWRNQGSRVPSRFDGLLIENCHLARCDRNGITGKGNASRRRWFPSLNVVIRGNLLEDIGGDGIVPHSTDGALVEHNRVYGIRLRDTSDPRACAGIWPWSCDNTLIQFNEVCDVKGTKDGQGFDSDYNCRNTVFQYNYSHDNEGGFFLICESGGSRTNWLKSIGNIGTIIRHNVSINDRQRTFHIAGNATGTRIHDNVIINTVDEEIPLVLATSWDGLPGETHFEDNLFYFTGRALYTFGKRRHRGKKNDGTYFPAPGFEKLPFTFRSNIYFGTHVDRPEDPESVAAQPLPAEALAEIFDEKGKARRGLDIKKLLRLKELAVGSE